MRRTENNSRKYLSSKTEDGQLTASEKETGQTDSEINLSYLAEAAGRLCEVVGSACRNRSQFKESTQKGKRAKTDVKAVKEMCAVLKELTGIVRSLGEEEESEGEEVGMNVLEVLFSDEAEEYAG